MDKDNGMGAFFASPFAKKYLECSDNLVRRSVTGISAACEIMRSEAEKDGSKKENEMIEHIMTMCCDLIRNAELSKTLAASVMLPEDRKIIRADLFLSKFAAECAASSAGKCSVNIKEASSDYMETDRDTLRYLLLIFIRKKMNAFGGEKTEFEIECEKKLKTLNITLRSLRTFVDEEAVYSPDVFDEFPIEVCMGLAKRIGAAAAMNDDSLTVEIPLAGIGSTGIVAAPQPEFEMGFFNPFNIMLRGI